MDEVKKKQLSPEQQKELLETLKSRFEKNIHRHQKLEWREVESKLKANPEKLWSLYQMETTGGEPDVVKYDQDSGETIFFDCAAESPKGRRSACYDPGALKSRKKFPPKQSAVGLATEMRIELLTEDEYTELQRLEEVDTKTSSWLKTPAEVRERGGAIFGDRRYGRVFFYHNGAESYYAARGFRGSLKL